MDVTIQFHCPSCDRDGFVKILGGEPPTPMVCPACGHELAEVQCGYSDPTIFGSLVGDPNSWGFEKNAQFGSRNLIGKKPLRFKSTPHDLPGTGRHAAKNPWPLANDWTEGQP